MLNTELTISLPQTMRDFIDGEVVAGNYNTADEYVRDLIAEAKSRKAEERLEALLLEALDSGEPITVTPEYWQHKRTELAARYGSREEGV